MVKKKRKRTSFVSSIFVLADANNLILIKATDRVRAEKLRVHGEQPRLCRVCPLGGIEVEPGAAQVRPAGKSRAALPQEVPAIRVGEPALGHDAAISIKVVKIQAHLEPSARKNPVICGPIPRARIVNPRVLVPVPLRAKTILGAINSSKARRRSSIVRRVEIEPRSAEGMPTR